jgi:hypothetical protein
VPCWSFVSCRSWRHSPLVSAAESVTAMATLAQLALVVAMAEPKLKPPLPCRRCSLSSSIAVPSWVMHTRHCCVSTTHRRATASIRVAASARYRRDRSHAWPSHHEPPRAKLSAPPPSPHLVALRACARFCTGPPEGHRHRRSRRQATRTRGQGATSHGWLSCGCPRVRVSPRVLHHHSMAADMASLCRKS